MRGFDDQRMKDLANRLVAMSPEPPPFPEEVTVTKPRVSKPSPVLMFAGAAVIVLILAAIPILMFGRGGGEGVVATTTTTTVPVTESTQQTVTSTTQATSTTEATTTTSTTVPLEATAAVVYLIQDPESSFTGNPALVPFHTVVPAPASTTEAMLSLQLVTGDLTVPTGFTTMIPSEVEVIGVTAAEHMITVDMNQAFVDGAGGLLADFTMLNQLIYTASQVGEIESVLFTVNGEPVTAFGSEGLNLSQPVARDSFLEHLNSVIVTNPVQGEDGVPLVVSGAANVFEATVSLEVRDADGNVVYDDFTTATCGTGCWGGYSFEVQYEFTGDETVRVFWHSPEDGSPADVVTIPILWNDDDGWPLVGG